MTELSPVQQDVLDQLGAAASARPEFPAELRYELRGELEKAIGDRVHLLGDDDRIFANKYAIASALGCEGRFLAERDFPGWSVPLAKGSVVHKAIELSVNWRGVAHPLDIVDEALASLEHGEQGIGEFIQGLREADRAQLRSEAVSLVTAFSECWPPLKREWRPVTESQVRLELFDGRVVLQGKIDLTLGRAAGLRAGKVLVDLKSGVGRPHHLDDLRYYALIETIRIGVPPRLLASYYLDQGIFHTETVTADILFSAVGRVADGIGRMIELHLAEREPRLHVGPQCKWCRALETCDTGQRHLREFDDPLEEFS